MKRIGLIFLALLAQSAAAQKSEIKVGFSFAKPPYVFATVSEYDGTESKDNSGIEIELFQEALKGTGFTFKPVYWSFKRITLELEKGNLDAAETSGPDAPGIFYSKALIACENYAISRKASQHTITSIDSLKNLSIVAWQGARTDLGVEFNKMARNNPDYLEIHDQEAQYKMFRNGHIDVIVIDKYIYQWWDNENAKKTGAPIDVVYHPLFPGFNEYRIGFRSERLRDAFNAGLERIKADGTRDRIMQKYIGNSK